MLLTNLSHLDLVLPTIINLYSHFDRLAKVLWAAVYTEVELDFFLHFQKSRIFKKPEINYHQTNISSVPIFEARMNDVLPTCHTDSGLNEFPEGTNTNKINLKRIWKKPRQPCDRVTNEGWHFLSCLLAMLTNTLIKGQSPFQPHTQQPRAQHSQS